MVNRNVIYAYIDEAGRGCFSWEPREGATKYVVAEWVNGLAIDYQTRTAKIGAIKRLCRALHGSARVHSGGDNGMVTMSNFDVLWAEDSSMIRCACGNELILSESQAVTCECGRLFRYSCILEEITMAKLLGGIKLYVVGRNVGASWEFFGVFDTKEQADDQCKDETYFVGPVTLNAVLSTEAQEWPESYRFEVENYEKEN